MEPVSDNIELKIHVTLSPMSTNADYSIYTIIVDASILLSGIFLPHVDAYGNNKDFAIYICPSHDKFFLKKF